MVKANESAPHECSLKKGRGQSRTPRKCSAGLLLSMTIEQKYNTKITILQNSNVQKICQVKLICI